MIKNHESAYILRCLDEEKIKRRVKRAFENRAGPRASVVVKGGKICGKAFWVEDFGDRRIVFIN